MTPPPSEVAKRIGAIHLVSTGSHDAEQVLLLNLGIFQGLVTKEGRRTIRIASTRRQSNIENFGNWVQIHSPVGGSAIIFDLEFAEEKCAR